MVRILQRATLEQNRMCDKEYKCTLDGENTDWGWFDIENLPKPLFPTLYSSLLRIL